jgi:hypothetical protein
VTQLPWRQQQPEPVRLELALVPARLTSREIEIQSVRSEIMAVSGASAITFRNEDGPTLIRASEERRT